MSPISRSETEQHFSYNKNTNWSFANLTIDSGGTLTHAANSTTALGKQYAIDFTLSGNLTVNGTINVDGKGYAAIQGPGARMEQDMEVVEQVMEGMEELHIIVLQEV